MAEQSLRSLLETAAADVETYRDPDIWEAKRRLSEVLVAAGYGSIVSDTVDYLQVTPEAVHVRVSWSSYGCDCDASHSIPGSVIDDPDPLKAAKRWRLDRKRAEIAAHLKEAIRLQAHWGGKLAEVEAEMAAA